MSHPMCVYLQLWWLEWQSTMCIVMKIKENTKLLTDTICALCVLVYYTIAFNVPSYSVPPCACMLRRALNKQNVLTYSLDKGKDWTTQPKQITSVFESCQALFIKTQTTERRRPPPLIHPPADEQERSNSAIYFHLSTTPPPTTWTHWRQWG